MEQKSDLRALIAGRWNAWVESDEHRLSCAAYSEGQACCVDPEHDLFADLPDSDFGGHPRHANVVGHQNRLLDLVMLAIAEKTTR